MYDSLGEAYLDDGNKILALAKALELDPGNGNPARTLERMEAP